MERNKTYRPFAPEELSQAVRQAHQQRLLADIEGRSHRWADRIHTWRQLGIASVVLVLLAVATPPVVAQGMPSVHVRTDSPTHQQHPVVLANEIISQL